MKRAAAADARRRVHKRTARNCPIFSKIAVQNLAGFSDILFEPNSGLFAICGATGVGKSTLLEIMELGLRPISVGSRANVRRRYGDPIIEMKIETDIGPYHRIIDTRSISSRNVNGFEPEFKLITLYERTEVLRDIFEDINPSIAIEGSEPRFLPSKDLSLVSRVVGKSYDSIECFEVEDPDFPDDVVPYFRVLEQGVSYDLRSMGTGELSAIYLIWSFNYMKPKSIILVEEPEAMLPPSSHLGMLDIICAKALERSMAVVIATHSPDIIMAIPDEQILPLHRFEGTTSCASDKDRKLDALQNLGLRPAKQGLILVEDELALLVASELISRLDIHLWNCVEIRNIGSGFGQIKDVLEALPRFDSIKIIGLLDGDMETDAKKWKSADVCCFLPFKTSAEAELLAAIRDRKNEFAVRSGRSVMRLERGLQRAQSVESHDAFKYFCEETGLSQEICSIMAFGHWLDQKNSLELCNKTLSSVKKLLRM